MEKNGEKGEILCEETYGRYQFDRIFGLFIGILVFSFYSILIVGSILVFTNILPTPPAPLTNWIIGILIAFLSGLIPLYFWIHERLCRKKLTIYENGLIPEYISFKEYRENKDGFIHYKDIETIEIYEKEITNVFSIKSHRWGCKIKLKNNEKLIWIEWSMFKNKDLSMRALISLKNLKNLSQNNIKTSLNSERYHISNLGVDIHEPKPKS